jgi:predicted GNAT family acetyltransferase
MTAANDTLWEQILRADEANQAYFAERAELPGVSLFCAERADAPEFDVALIYGVSEDAADATLRTIADYYRERGRQPRVRLSPVSMPADWPDRLERAGFAEAGERFVYFSAPKLLQLQTNSAVRVVRAVTAEDGDRFSAIQVIGFAIPPAHQEWDRQLAQRHLAAGQHAFYLAWLDGQVVGAARSIRLPNGMTAMAALATIPDACGRGIGTSLLARMVKDARKDGSRVSFGAVVAGSYAAGMYERLGFAFHFETRTFIEGQCLAS